MLEGLVGGLVQSSWSCTRVPRCSSSVARVAVAVGLAWDGREGAGVRVAAGAHPARVGDRRARRVGHGLGAAQGVVVAQGRRVEDLVERGHVEARCAHEARLGAVGLGGVARFQVEAREPAPAATAIGARVARRLPGDAFHRLAPAVLADRVHHVVGVDVARPLELEARGAHRADGVALGAAAVSHHDAAPAAVRDDHVLDLGVVGQLHAVAGEAPDAPAVDAGERAALEQREDGRPRDTARAAGGAADETDRRARDREAVEIEVDAAGPKLDGRHVARHEEVAGEHVAPGLGDHEGKATGLVDHGLVDLDPPFRRTGARRHAEAKRQRCQHPEDPPHPHLHSPLVPPSRLTRRPFRV